MTLEEYAQLPDDDLYLDEVSRGRLVCEPRPGYEHGRVQVRLVGVLAPFVHEHGLGEVIVASGFILERDPLPLSVGRTSPSLLRLVLARRRSRAGQSLRPTWR